MTAAIADVEIGECRLDTDADIVLADAQACLDAPEAARAARFIFPRDRDRFVRAHGYVRRRLGAFLRMPAAEVPIVGGEGEKPFVDGRPVSFSLSHSGSTAVLAVAAGGDLGVDVETLDRSESLAADLEGLCDFCLTATERAAVFATSRDQRIRRFLSYWTAKEARMKLLGEGMALAPHTISLALADGAPVGYLRPRAPKADLRFVRLSRPDAICCLAVRR